MKLIEMELTLKFKFNRRKLNASFKRNVKKKYYRVCGRLPLVVPFDVSHELALTAVKQRHVVITRHRRDGHECLAPDDNRGTVEKCHHLVDQLLVLNQPLRVHAFAHQGCKHCDDRLLHFGHAADQTVEDHVKAGLVDDMLKQSHCMSGQSAQRRDGGELLSVARAMRKQVPQHLKK